MGSIDTAAIKQSVDLVELAGRYTQLRPVASHEYAGACPRCGGDDRFHVRPSGWFCRQCHPTSEHGWSDCIALVQWIEGVGFLEAAQRLSGPGLITPATKAQPARSEPKHKSQAPSWAREAAAEVERAQALIWQPEGRPGLDYLHGRGFTDKTIRAFEFGYMAQTPTKARAAAIVMPWYLGGVLTAVRLRFLEKQDQGKVASLKGSMFGGRLYAGHALDLGPDEIEGVAHMRTLIIVEGELNAAAIWQVSRETRLDVLSLGSESARLTDAMIRYARQYGQVLTWLDRPELADRMAADLPGSWPISDYDGTDKRDANDLLGDGLLGGFLAAVRMAACEGDPDRMQRLYFDLLAGLEVQPDPGVGAVMKQIDAGRRAWADGLPGTCEKCGALRSECCC